MITVPLTAEDIANIQKNYGEIVTTYCRKSPDNKIANKKNLRNLQELVNAYAITIYDKHGRSIIRIGETDYLDITCPIISFELDNPTKEFKVLVSFRETDKNGKF
jgi:hypothetical protein